jgi:hypothetical protein
MNHNENDRVALYTKSIEYAKAHGELEDFQESYDYTKDTAVMLSMSLVKRYSDSKFHKLYWYPYGEHYEYVNRTYDSNLLDCGKVFLDLYFSSGENMDRVAVVLACTILGEFRIARTELRDHFNVELNIKLDEEVIEWAKSIDKLDEINKKSWTGYDFEGNTHPAMLNTFAKWFIEKYKICKSDNHYVYELVDTIMDTIDPWG